MVLQINLQTHIKDINNPRLNTSVDVEFILIMLRVRDANLMIIEIMAEKVESISFWIAFNQLYNFILNVY